MLSKELRIVADVLRVEYGLDLTGDHNVSVPELADKIAMALSEAKVDGWRVFLDRATEDIYVEDHA